MVDKEKVTEFLTVNVEESVKDKRILNLRNDTAIINQNYNEIDANKKVTIGIYNDEIYCLNDSSQYENDASDCHERSKYVILRKYTKIFTIPDFVTLKALMDKTDDPNKFSKIHEIDPALLADPSTEIVLEPLTTLKQNGDGAEPVADEFMRITIAKITIMYPVVRFLLDGPHLVPDLINGAILRVPAFSNSSYFTVWLPHTFGNNGLLFGTIDKKNFSVNVEKWSITDYWDSRSRYTQQEARVMLLPDGESIFIIYTARFYNYLKFSQMYAIMSRNSSNNQYNIPSSPIWIDYKKTEHNKNFIPFLHNNTIYLIPSFYPMVVLRLEMAFNALSPVTQISGSHNPSSLPWRSEYGTNIRGGTPALSVPGKGYYLLFFHTRQRSIYGVDHYFMGAMTICSRPPFNIRSMSRVPIVVDPLWYEGPWFNKYASYVVYPIGIDIDPNDSHHVMVSIGHQDRNIYLVKFNIEALVKSLDEVHLCPPG
eukprot:CAMPEP_0119047136 /NCGR_PEP_ID=MMETSP1177-20130426/51145_1 /TAXON_ID=2985 /ORGANISM="Ochromonas sp, Strain CCMP1899" /LENGTH=481 /DNA_ID=CAMNT_0007021279 /DNA_START=290 /DNA_END=1735 /DNA_ORIENTATION=+